MKKRKLQYLLLGFALLLILSTGCHDVEIVTRIFPNGSILRSISMPGDSTKIYDSAYPMPSDTSWQVTSKTRKRDSNDFVYTVTIYSRNASEINKDLLSLPDTVLYIRPVVKLEKRFRWFYTFFSYYETYKAHGLQFSNSDSLFAREIEKKIGEQDSTGEQGDSADIEEELIFEDLYQIILSATEEIKDPSLSSKLVRKKKQELHDYLMGKDIDLDRFVDQVIQACTSIYKTRNVEKLKPFIEAFNKKLVRYLNFIERSIGETYNNSVIMPGIITATNAPKVDANKASWEVDSDKFETKDYQMWVESRRMNVLPTIFTALLLLACIAGILLITRKMNKEKHGPDDKAKSKNHKSMNEWIIILLVISGAGLFLFFGWLAIAFWNFGFLTIQFISMKEKILFVFLSLVGLILLIIGIIHLLRRRFLKKQ